MPWTWDPSSRTYRETDTGQTLNETQLRPIVRNFLGAAIVRTREITGQLANGALSTPEWEVEMRRIVKETFGAAYVLSRGGRESMTQRDWGRLGQLARSQYQYLNEYAQDVAAAGLTRDRALSRSELYVASARQAYQRGKLATFPELPRLARVPGDGSTRCVMNCLPGDQLVSARGLLKGYKRWYDGDVLTLTTRMGRRLTVTPNHPMLTRRGWVAANELHVGEDLVDDGFLKRVGLIDPDIQDLPAPVAQVVGALEQLGRAERVMGVAMDFHGDGRYSKVEVVGTDRQLRHVRDLSALQPHLELEFSRLAEYLPTGESRSRTPAQFIRASIRPAHSQIGGAHASLSLTRRGRPHTHAIGIAAPSRRNAGAEQLSSQDVPIHLKDASEREFAFSRHVASHHFPPREIGWQPTTRSSGRLASLFDEAFAERAEAASPLARDLRESLASSNALDQLVHVDRQPFHGYVYNLETESGLYAAPSVIEKNCRCELDLGPTDAGWDVYWLDLGDDRECRDCQQLASEWSPLQVARVTTSEEEPPA